MYLFAFEKQCRDHGTCKAGSCLQTEVAVLGGRKKETERILKGKELKTQKESMWNVKPKVIPRKWKHLRITPTIPEQHTGRARNQGTAKKSHNGQCTHTVVSTNVRAQNIQHGK